mgnify:CR=1 FL=1
MMRFIISYFDIDYLIIIFSKIVIIYYIKLIIKHNKQQL